MIRSMTGYGRDQQLLHGRSITVEIRSVNHRYFEFSCRAPRGCAFLEDRLKRALQSAISRGKVEVALTLQTVESRNTSVAVDHALAGQYITALRALGEEYALPDDLTLSTVCRLPDIFTLCRGEEDEEELAADVPGCSPWKSTSPSWRSAPPKRWRNTGPVSPPSSPSS